jgi:hypothetical protein
MSLLLSLAAALVALVALFFGLRFFDILAGRPFRSKDAAARGGVVNIIHSDPRATAHYYGLRFLGACILFGLVVGAIRYAL